MNPSLSRRNEIINGTNHISFKVDSRLDEERLSLKDDLTAVLQ